MRYCVICRIYKPLGLFSLKSKNCRPCLKISRRKRYLKNRTKEIEMQINRYKLNKESYDKTAKEWRRNNRKKRNQTQYEWNNRNRDKVRITQNKQSLKNPGKFAHNLVMSIIRRSKRPGAAPKWLTKEQKLEIKSWYDARIECQWLSEEQLHVDHIIPLHGKNVCGLHVPWNLQILTASQNSKKGNKF